MRYWDNDGAHQDKVEKLTELLPFFGPVANAKTTNKRLEKFRKAQNCYYDLYNNGLCNRASSFAKVFGIAARDYRYVRSFRYMDCLYRETEQVMDKIVLEAAIEQGFTSGL